MSAPSSIRTSIENIRKMPDATVTSVPALNFIETDADGACSRITDRDGHYYQSEKIPIPRTPTPDGDLSSKGSPTTKSSQGAFNFIRDKAGSFHRRAKKGRSKASKLSSQSFHAHSVTASPLFVATQLACVPIGTKVPSEHKNTALSRTVSLRLDKRFSFGKGLRLSPCSSKENSTLALASKSLEALAIDGGDGKKQRGSSIRRQGRPRAADDSGATSDSNAAQSDQEFSKVNSLSIRETNQRGLTQSESSLDSSRVGCWASSFEKLLGDPAGLHTFAEFLKKEYSHENIYFWTACERYKGLAEIEDRRQVAKQIFDRHLGLSASEPVNVDSHARQIAQDGLSNPDEFLFMAAQKQIFNLMKFDSYSRFLKSELYNECLSQERKGIPLPYSGTSLDPDLAITANSYNKQQLQKSRSDADDRRRKSLLPWHRKDRSKSKERGADRGVRRGQGRSTSESSSARFDLSDSRTSLSSSDRAVSRESITSADAISLNGSDAMSLCRFMLPDQSNSVLVVRQGETVRDVVRQLLEKRRIQFSDFNVVLTKGNKVVDLNKDASLLAGLEVRVERMVLFTVRLPSRKVIIVKAKPHKLATDVLKPVLSKYGLKLDLMFVYTLSDVVKGINLKGTVTELDGQKLHVQTKEEVKEWSDPGKVPRRNNSLEEVTNRVFEDLLNGKAKTDFDDLGIMDFDSRSSKTEPTSDSSSSFFSGSSRRQSLSLERNASFPNSASGRLDASERLQSDSKRSNPSEGAAKTKQDDADLYEGLKRAQLFSLDDQRGTEINFELPDFLKMDANKGPAASPLSALGQVSSEESDFQSKEHPEFWGGFQGGSLEDLEEVDSADTTLVPNHDLDLDEVDDRQRSNKENLPSNNNNVHFSNNNIHEVLPSKVLTPPPPLPPKPKVGALIRGPPPRPPSRPLSSLSRQGDPLDPPLHAKPNRPTANDRCSVSFV